MSEAALCSAAGVPAATPLRSSTPQNPSSSPPQNHQCCVHSEDLILHHNLQRGNGSFEGTRSQLLPGTPQVDRTKTVGTLVMRGVVTGPARWRGSRVASGTPNLYCAVYKYSVTQCTLCSSDSSAQSSSEFPDSAFSSLPPPTLVSSTWGQGPLVIEGVPVLERHADTRIEGAEKGSSCRDDEIQSFFVLTVGVFHSRIDSNSSTSLISEAGTYRKNVSTPLPRTADLLGVLHIPLHCINIMENQQEVKLRLPVTPFFPKSGNYACPAEQNEAEGEQQLAAVLNPATSLQALEKVFADGLNVSSTGANRCNVMLFRLSSNGGSFLPSSDAALQAALAAPAPPSVASTSLQRSINPDELHDSETNKLAYQCPTGSKISHGSVKAEASQAAHVPNSNSRLPSEARAVGNCCRTAPPSHGNWSDSAATHAKWSRKDVAGQLLSPSHRQQSVADVAGTTRSLASNNLSKDQQRQRHQRRQQELSVAAVLAASAIAAAARGERDRSSRSCTSKKPQHSQQLVSLLGMRSTQRPSSVCGVVASNRTLMEKECNGSLSLHQPSLGHESNRILQERWIPVTGKRIADRTTELTGEPELSPDDSVSVRGDETHRFAETLANRGAKSAHSVASCMLVEGLVPSACSARLNSLLDDRKSTLTTSIRRLDCLMTRAQLLLSQRRHRQLQQGEYHLAPSHDPVHGDRTEQEGITSTSQSAPTESLKNPCGTSDSSDAFTTGRRESIHEVLTNDVEQPQSKSPQNYSLESTELQGPSPGSPAQQGHPTHGMPDRSFTAKVVRWINAQAARQKDLLTKKLVLLVWAQRAQLERHRRDIHALRLASVSESVSQKAAHQHRLLLLGWLSLRAHAGQRPCQNQHERQRQSTTDREEKCQQVGGNLGRGGEQQVQELIHLVEGLQKQVQASDDWCKHLEERSSEEQQKHKQELGALRRQIIELQEELKQKGRKYTSPPSSPTEDKERQQVQQELDMVSQERRQLQLLAAEHAKAKACAEQEQMRLQNELAANQERTRDLEHQLLLVDQQLLGILNQATAHSETTAGLTHLEPSPPLGTWALKKLQGMRETLRGIDGKAPLARTTPARRQPPLEAATFAPLQKLSPDSARHAENVKGQVPSLTEQQQCLRALSQQRPTTPQYHHPAQLVQEAQASPPTRQLPESDSNKNQPQQQQAGRWTNERCEPPTGHQGMAERQHADLQPAAGNCGDLKTAGEIQHQRIYLPQGAHVVPRSQQLKEQLSRQRTHRQQLLQQCAHPPQQTLYTQMNPHLQASFSSTFRDPQVAVQNYAVCSFPLQLRKGTNPGPAAEHRFRGVSPQCNGGMTPPRVNARCLGFNVT